MAFISPLSRLVLGAAQMLQLLIEPLKGFLAHDHMHLCGQGMGQLLLPARGGLTLLNEP